MRRTLPGLVLAAFLLSGSTAALAAGAQKTSRRATATTWSKTKSQIVVPRDGETARKSQKSRRWSNLRPKVTGSASRGGSRENKLRSGLFEIEAMPLPPHIRQEARATLVQAAGDLEATVDSANDLLTVKTRGRTLEIKVRPASGPQVYDSRTGRYRPTGQKTRIVTSRVEGSRGTRISKFDESSGQEIRTDLTRTNEKAFRDLERMLQ